MSSEGFKETEIGLIPEDWDIIPLKNLTEKIGSGATPKGGSQVYIDHGVRFIRSQNVHDEGFKNDLVYITDEAATKLNNVELLSKDILLNITGDSICRTSIVPDEALPGRVNQHVAIIRANSKLYHKFLFFYLCSDIAKWRLLSYDAGGTRKAITKKTLELFTIPLPEYKEQIAISDLLDSFNQKIHLNQQINQILEVIGQSIFRHWFVHFEFPNSEGQPYKSSGGEMVDSELGEIPKGWEIGKLGDLISITSGKRPKEKSEKQTIDFKIPLIGASSLMGYVKETLYNKPILVIGRVGTHGIIQKITPPSYPSDNTLVITSKYYEFVYQILRRIDYDSLNVGTTQPLITQKSIKNQEIIIPSQKILFTHENIISSLSIKMMENNSENEYLSKIRDYLLPKLMSGKIRVNIPEEATVK